jgi:cysteinyl-tRNA synthetase
MDIRLQNTLSGEKEIFKPIKEGEVSMYNCGPTVYDYAHIGNLRSYVFADVLRRMFKYNGYKVNQVINITDIGHLSSDSDDGEDKMTKALKREGKPLTLSAMREVADFYFEKFKEDLVALNIEPPEHFPFASDHIAEDIDLVKTLTEKGFTYTTSDGIYFDTGKFADYGKLGNIPKGDDEHSRIGVNPEKKNSRDFALWKFSGKFNNELGYEANFGKGFPGWHIECSAMSIKYLGPEFDIHTGGIDHIPVHHNNEIAQSICAGYPYTKIWMHNAFLTINDGKMAKSEGNFITLQTLKIEPLAYRYFLLNAYYDTPINISEDAFQGAQNGLKNLRRAIATLNLEEKTEEGLKEKYASSFKTYINNNLGTPQALALVWDLINDGKISGTDKLELIKEFDKVLGLELDKAETFEIPEEIQKLILERDSARAEKDFAKSDELRAQIEKLGFEVMDTPEGTKVEKK